MLLLFRCAGVKIDEILCLSDAYAPLSSERREFLGFFFLAAPGLRCGTRDHLSPLHHAGSFI